MLRRLNKGDTPAFDDTQFLNAVWSAADYCRKRHNDACYLYKTGGRLVLCEGCVLVTNPAFSQLRGIPVGGWRWGVCTGVH